MTPKIEWQFTFDPMRDGKKLRTARFEENENDEIDLVCIFINGKSEWIEKYDTWISEFESAKQNYEKLNSSNIRWVGYDHRGQGDSKGQSLFVKNFDIFADDLKDVLKIHNPDDKPFVIFAHSMGALTAIYSMCQNEINPKCAVLSAPFLGLSYGKIPIWVVRTIAYTAKMLGFARMYTGAGHFERKPFETNKLTHDPEIYEIIKTSRFKTRSPTFGWITSCFSAQSKVFKSWALKQFRVPTLMFSAGEDHVVDSSAQAAWVLQASHYSPAPIEFEKVENSYHEVFGEHAEIRGPVLKRSMDFVEKNI